MIENSWTYNLDIMLFNLLMIQIVRSDLYLFGPKEDASQSVQST